MTEVPVGPRAGLLIIGFMAGVVAYYYGGEPRTEIKFVDVERVVEKLVPVERVVVKEVVVPTVVEKVVVKEVPTTKTVIQTKTVYVPDTKEKNSVHEDDLYCMALNIYREAANQSLAGMVAVGRVVMNRVNDRRFPGTVCEVIYEGPVKESWKTKQNPNLAEEDRVYYPRKNLCQFSWYCDGKRDEVINTENNIKWQTATDIAYDILAYDRWKGLVEGSTHYHANYVKPTWRKSMTLVAHIDDHIFYRAD